MVNWWFGFRLDPFYERDWESNRGIPSPRIPKTPTQSTDLPLVDCLLAKSMAIGYNSHDFQNGQVLLKVDPETAAGWSQGVGRTEGSCWWYLAFTEKKMIDILAGGFTYLFMFIPTWGNDPI